ncbi:transcription termination factor 4, mitochondrial [Pogona vitticeps]
MSSGALGRLCGQVLQRHSSIPFAYHCIQLSLKASVVARLCSFQHPGCRFHGTSSHEASVALHSFKVNSNESSQKLLEACTTSQVEQRRPDGVDHLNQIKSKLGKIADSFLDMGFSPAEIKDLFSLQSILSPQSILAVVSELFLLGISTDFILKALKKNPELLRMPEKHMTARAALLRKYGFTEGSLNHMANSFPMIFTLPVKRFVALEQLLRDNCLFTMEQISRILQLCPSILLEELSDVEYQFQFAYFRMGVKHKEITNSCYFQVPLERIKNRVIFLERLGRYQTPDKKGQTQVVNPKLKALIRASEHDFVTKIAHSSVEEYEIFKKLLAREKEEEWLEEAGMQNEESDSENDAERSDSE